MTDIFIEKGDLTDCNVDAVVNAANSDLVLGAGVAGAIARRGGPGIQAECTAHGPIAVGQAAITGAGNLPARHVIHQASMRLGAPTTADGLRRSTGAALALADEHGLRTIAFPATGTGIGGLDVRDCARIMLTAAREHIRAGTDLAGIYFILFDERTAGVFREVADELSAE